MVLVVVDVVVVERRIVGGGRVDITEGRRGQLGGLLNPGQEFGCDSANENILYMKLMHTIDIL